MSHPWLFSHAPSSMSTSSSSPIYPTTQREHSVHPAHLQGPSVDKLRHQESVRSRIKAYSGDPYQLFDVQEILEKKITELLSPKKWKNSERLGRLVCRILSRHPTFNRRYTSTIPQGALQILISKMESYKRCCFHHCMPRKLRGNPMQWSCRRERGKCTIHSRQIEKKV